MTNRTDADCSTHHLLFYELQLKLSSASLVKGVAEAPKTVRLVKFVPEKVTVKV